MTMGSELAWLLFVDDGSVGQRGINHNPVRVHLLLQRTILSQYVIVHPILVKTTSQPALHRVTTEMRKWEAKPGMIWVCCTVVGMAGILRVHVCVEYRRSPLSGRALMGLLVGRLLVMGAVVVRNDLLHQSLGWPMPVWHPCQY
jgi:hypothetical protein